MSLPDSSGRQFEVFDPESARLLAVGFECCEDVEGHPRFSCSHGNGTLLAYYFGRGKRDVLVRSGPNEGVHAHLTTSWKHGAREWILDW